MAVLATALAVVGAAARGGGATAPDLEALREAGHWKQIRATIEPRFRANPQDAEAVYWMARLKAVAGSLDEAHELAKKAATMSPKSADAQFVLAWTTGRVARKAGLLRGLSLVGDFKRACNSALALNPRHIEALQLMIEFHASAPGIAGGSKTKAREQLQTLAAVDPVRSALIQADWAFQEKNRAEGERWLRRAVEIGPTSYVALARLASFCLDSTAPKPEEAAALATRAITVDPGRARGYALLATAQARLDRWRDIDDTLARAEQHVPDDLSPFFAAGRLLVLAKREPQRAERYFRKYLAQPPELGAQDHAAAHWRLALALEQQGRKADAVAELEAALRLRPGFEEAQKDLKRLK